MPQITPWPPLPPHPNFSSLLPTSGSKIVLMQMTEILAMRREEQQLREQLTAAERSNAEAEAALEAARSDALNRKTEQER